MDTLRLRHVQVAKEGTLGAILKVTRQNVLRTAPWRYSTPSRIRIHTIGHPGCLFLNQMRSIGT